MSFPGRWEDLDLDLTATLFACLCRIINWHSDHLKGGYLPQNSFKYAFAMYHFYKHHVPPSHLKLLSSYTEKGAWRFWLSLFQDGNCLLISPSQLTLVSIAWYTCMCVQAEFYFGCFSDELPWNRKQSFLQKIFQWRIKSIILGEDILKIKGTFKQTMLSALPSSLSLSFSAQQFGLFDLEEILHANYLEMNNWSFLPWYVT